MAETKNSLLRAATLTDAVARKRRHTVAAMSSAELGQMTLTEDQA